jgi:hypothetical protein
MHNRDESKGAWMMRYSQVLVISAIVLLCGCNTTLLLKKQQLQYLTSEYDNLQVTNKLLTSNPNPEILGHASVFVSIPTLNNVLKAADNLSGKIPSIPGTTFHIDSVRTNFVGGFPEVDVKAWAQKGDLKLGLTVSAVIEPTIPNNDPSKMVFNVHILQVVPVAHWTIFTLKIGGFVNQLLHVKLQEYIDLLPAFSVPLRSNLAFANPAGAQSIRATTNDGYVDGVIQVPAFSYEGILSVDRALFLEDGVHVFLSIH